MRKYRILIIKSMIKEQPDNKSNAIIADEKRVDAMNE